jgi:hypothetical protein
MQLHQWLVIGKAAPHEPELHMYKSLIALAFPLAVSACAGQQAKVATTQECKTVARDETESRIATKQECSPAAEKKAAKGTEQ